MADLTLEQQRALALAEATMRAAESEGARKNTISAKGLRGFESNAGGAAFGNPNLRAGADRGGEMSDIPYIMGGNASEAASKMGASPEVAGGIGTAVNFGLNAAPMFVGGGFGGAAGKAAAPLVESGARTLMRSALKPLATIDEARKARAVTTMLENNANVNQGGISKLLNKEAILAGQEKNLVSQSPASISTADVVAPLDELKARFLKQVLPNSDVATVDAAKQEFLAHPLLQKQRMSAQLAQELKQGTYQRLGDRAYTGELKNAEAESGKALARGLREHLEQAIPEVGPINKERSDLINAIKIATRREAVEGNKNPFGLSMLAHSPQVALAMMADRSATFRSALANFMYANKTAIPTTIGAATGAGAGAGAATGYGNLNELQRR